MSYNRFNTPRAYVDSLSFNLAHGWRDLDNITTIQDDGSTAVTFDGGSEASLFDMRPTNYAQISHDTQSFYIQIDTFDTDQLGESNFIAILNHNFVASECMFKVQISDETAMDTSSGDYGTTVSASANHTKIINSANATGGNSDFIKPAYNGWSLFTWSTQNDDNRYVRITFKDYGGASANFNADPIIGSILYGKTVDFPAISLDVNTSIDYGEGTKLQNSIGGNTYANTSHFAQPTWAVTNPWSLSQVATANTYSFTRRNGRLSHNMKMEFIADSDLFGQDMHSSSYSEFYDDGSLQSQFFNKILGNHLPFLFTIDSSSTDEGDYSLFRLADSKLNATQVAHRTWSTQLNLVETW